MNEMISDRDMMYGGYYQNIPGNTQYANFGFQGCPGTLMNGNMFPNMMGVPQNNNIMQGTNNIMDVNTRLNNLETRVRLIEQRLSGNNSYQEDNNSMYMI